jgi:hypothetical protein
MVESKVRVAWHAKVRRRVIGEQRMLSSRRVFMAIVAFCLTVKEIVAAALRAAQLDLSGEEGVEFG